MIIQVKVVWVLLGEYKPSMVRVYNNLHIAS